MVLGSFVVATPLASAQSGSASEPDAKTLRFVQRAIAWYPDSTFRLVENTRYRTASGSYRVVVVERQCASQFLTGQPMVVVDEVTNSAWLGSVAELPFQGAGAGPEALRTFIEGFLPEALKGAMNLKVRVVWDVGPRKPGAVIPLNLMIDTGYGEYRRPAGVTSDGKYLVMGSEMSLNDDPVAVRRRMLASSEFVIWDAPAGESPPLEIVEFSDLECPACKGKWPIIQMVLGRFAGSIRHGMVSFPLTAIHPWAFRAASASWCVALQNAESLIPFKETFYSLQREMEVSLVTPTSFDFLAGHGLDETTFKECYLRQPSISAVHKQIDLGQEMGIHSTPTYFVNGWKIQVPDGSWFPAMLERLLKGEEP
jgi:protein-disulfide isomerase